MVIQTDKEGHKRPNYFLSKEEAKILWRYAQKETARTKIMIGFALFRGLRIGEICAMHIRDFRDGFKKIRVIMSKTYIDDCLPLIDSFNIQVKDYVLNNAHLFKGGYLFPYYSSSRSPHILPKTADDLFAKLRRKIAADGHRQFLDIASNGKKPRFRITWHSCRRFFETYLWDKRKNMMELRDIMRYKDSRSVNSYINPYEVWKNEKDILNSTIGSLYNELNLFAEGQTGLRDYGF